MTYDGMKARDLVQNGKVTYTGSTHHFEYILKANGIRYEKELWDEKEIDDRIFLPIYIFTLSL